LKYIFGPRESREEPAEKDGKKLIGPDSIKLDLAHRIKNKRIKGPKIKNKDCK
jgi:hypothetical protein